MAVSIPHKLFTIDEYERMIEAGVFDEGVHVELIEGEIIEMRPLNPPHMAGVTRLNMLLNALLGMSAHVWVQNSIRLLNNSRPEPDIALIKWRDDFYEDQHATARDVLLLIEVSDTTLREDRLVKVPLYARAGVGEVWIVNLNERVVEVYSNVEAGGYRDFRRAEPGETLPLPGGLQGEVSVSSIFGRIAK